MGKTIIGISGTNGAGKDTVGLMLHKYHGYMFISVTEILRIELRRQGFPVDREHMRELSASWRRQFGYSVLVDRAIERFNEEPKGKYKGVAIASLRNPFEADKIHELGGSVWWIDADPLLRFTRIRANAASRARAGEDEKTFEQFLAEEKAEMYPSGDEATLNMLAVRDKADLAIDGGTKLELMQQEIAALMVEEPSDATISQKH